MLEKRKEGRKKGERKKNEKKIPRVKLTGWLFLLTVTAAAAECRPRRGFFSGRVSEPAYIHTWTDR